MAVHRSLKKGVGSCLPLDLKAILANFMIQGEKREKHLKPVLNEMDSDWQILCDDYTDYPAFHASHHMYIVMKIGGCPQKNHP